VDITTRTVFWSSQTTSAQGERAIIDSSSSRLRQTGCGYLCDNRRRNRLDQQKKENMGQVIRVDRARKVIAGSSSSESYLFLPLTLCKKCVVVQQTELRLYKDVQCALHRQSSMPCHVMPHMYFISIYLYRRNLPSPAFSSLSTNFILLYIAPPHTLSSMPSNLGAFSPTFIRFLQFPSFLLSDSFSFLSCF
jgi:hypothetical protein